jgi:SAM-dependent methyltransferase
MIDPRVERGDYTFGCLTVPQVRWAAPRPPPAKHLVDFVPDLRDRRETIGTLGNRDRSLGRIANRQAGDTEIGRLLLHASRIGNDELCLADKAHELDIAERLDQPHRTELFGEAEFGKTAARARMDREHERQSVADRREFGDDRSKRRGIVDIGRAMHCDDAETALVEPKLRPVSPLGDRAPQHLERIDHDVADPRDLVGRDPLPLQIGVGIRRWGPQQVRDRIGDEAVDFLRHRPIAAAQSRFEMSERQAKLLCDERASRGRIDVADNDDPARRPAQAHPLIGEHDPGGLLGVAARADAEMHIRRRQCKLLPEHIGHLWIVMLAGMHQNRAGPIRRRQLMKKRCDLHEVRPRRRDQVNLLPHYCTGGQLAGEIADLPTEHAIDDDHDIEGRENRYGKIGGRGPKARCADRARGQSSMSGLASSEARPRYPGKDLEALSFAPNYHRWILDMFRPFFGRHAVEVGAGSGNFSRLLATQGFTTLRAVEPSPEMFERLSGAGLQAASSGVSLHLATFGELAEDFKRQAVIDTIFYVNVLEHIDDDRSELRLVHDVLARCGRVLIFVPALPWLFGSHDRAVGHFRRYRKSELEEKVQGAGFRILFSRNFDMAGIIPWWVKYRLLQSTAMEPRAVEFYDKFVVPCARRIEGWVTPPIGKNVLLVAEKGD